MYVPSLFIHSSKTRAAFNFWLLGIILQSTWMFKSLLSILCEMDPEVNFLDHHTYFHSSYTTILSCQQRTVVPVTLCLCQLVIFFLACFIFSNSHPNDSMPWFWFAFPNISDTPHAFMCFLGLFMSSAEKCLFRPLAIFQLGRFGL
jgi:hypothetical protein